MVKMYPLEADTRLISIRKPYAVEYTTLTSKQLHPSMGCYNIYYLFYCQQKIPNKSILSGSLCFQVKNNFTVFNILRQTVPEYTCSE